MSFSSFEKNRFKCSHYLYLKQTTSEVTFPDFPKGQFNSWHQIKTVHLNFIRSRSLHTDVFSCNMTLYFPNEALRGLEYKVSISPWRKPVFWTDATPAHMYLEQRVGVYESGAGHLLILKGVDSTYQGQVRFCKLQTSEQRNHQGLSRLSSCVVFVNVAGHS